jgi:hypothetical protein
MSSVPTFVYVTYIESSPERVRHALTDADLNAAPARGDLPSSAR